MSTQHIGVEIGNIEIAQGNTIPVKTPEDFGYHNTYGDNLRYDGATLGKRWTVLTPPADGTPLAEESPFGYGHDIDVQANWLYRVEIVPWIRLGDNNDLNALKTVLRANHLVTYDNPDIHTHFYGFTQPQGRAVTFDIEPRQDRTVNVNGEYYTFIGWASSEPPLFQDANYPYHYDSQNIPYYLPEIQFSEQYIKKEWAAFFRGYEMTLQVTTNISDFNNTEKITYCLQTENMTYAPKAFQSIPAVPENRYQIIPPEQYGHAFKCIYQQASSSDSTNTKVFRGWYYGHWTNETTTPPSGNNWYPFNGSDYASPWFNFDAETITLTAVFTEETTNSFTITYWSGLPEGNPPSQL